MTFQTYKTNGVIILMSNNNTIKELAVRTRYTERNFLILKIKVCSIFKIRKNLK